MDYELLPMSVLLEAIDQLRRAVFDGDSRTAMWICNELEIRLLQDMAMMERHITGESESVDH